MASPARYSLSKPWIGVTLFGQGRQIERLASYKQGMLFFDQFSRHVFGVAWVGKPFDLIGGITPSL
jgi:hypothetical protein